MPSLSVIRLVAFLLSLAYFISTASAQSDAPFQITNLNIRKIGGANVTIQFSVHDPDPLTNATSLCSGTWETGSRAYPQGSYAHCGNGNSTFAWNMNSYHNIASFVLGVEHAFIDHSVGQPPYDEVTNFGKANVTEPAIVCWAFSHVHFCAQDPEASIEAPIYATIAKAR